VVAQPLNQVLKVGSQVAAHHHRLQQAQRAPGLGDRDEQQRLVRGKHQLVQLKLAPWKRRNVRCKNKKERKN
jgi:hypothetical protein